MPREFIPLTDTGESEVFLDKNLLNIDIKNIDYTKSNINEIIDKYSKLYAATDEKHSDSEFNKLVENQLHKRY